MKIAKRILAAVLAVAVVLSCWVWFAPQKNAAKAANLTGDSNYLFAYFTGTSIEGQTIHLAVSEDGLNYTALHNNDPVIVPSKGTGCVRDPYLWYNENDGYYYILATDLDFTDTGSDYSDNSESFIVWRSKNLVNWYDETMIDVKAILGRLGINNNNMQAVWAPQVLWDGSEFVVYFSLQCDGTSNGSWNPLTIVYLKTSNLLDESKYHEYGVIHNPGRHVIDADIIKKPNTNQYYMFYKDESASGGIQSIYYMISDNGPTGPYYAPDNANDGRGPQLFAEIGKNLEGCNSFFDDNGNLITFVDEYGYFNSLTNETEAHFHVSRSSDFSTFTTLPDNSHNINSLSPRHGSVVKITDEEYNRLLAYSSEITSSSFPETETLSDHLVGRYFTTNDYTYNAANGKNDLTVTDGTISATTDSDGDYYAYFNAAGAQINLANLISDDLNIKDGFTITFSASAPSSLKANTRFFDISNNWSQRTDPSECYLHMSPVADSNGLYLGAYNGPTTTASWTWASQGNNYNDDVMHDYIISFADGNMILYIDGQLAMKRDRYNMNAEYGDNFLTDNWFKEIGNSIMRIGKSEWPGSDPLFTGAMQNLCIYDCSLSYYDVQKMQKQFDAEAGKTTIAKIAVPETVYMKPVNGASTVGQYYVNNRIHDGSNEVSLEVNPAQTKGAVEFYIPGAKKFIIEVNTKTSGIGDIVLAEAGATSGSYENTEYDAGANGYFSYSTAGLYISGTGITPGNKALAEWKITVIMQDGSQTTHYAYSTLYAPYLNPVGVAIYVKSYRSGLSTLFGSSMAWVSGVHGFTNDPAANYYAKISDKSMVPLLGAIGTGDNENGPDNWISSSSGSNTLSTASFRYVAVNGNSSDFGAIGVYRSPVANLTIDTSRYSNFNQIPNLTVGFNFTDKENAKEQHWYVSDYTSGNMSYFNDYQYIDSRNNVNGQAAHYYNEDSDVPNNVISNNGLVNANVSTGAEHNAAWDRPVIKTGTSNKYIFKGAAYTYGEHATKKGVAYSVNYVQVNGTNVDKTELRNLVLKATYFEETNYTTTSWNNYKTALQNAALALGDPSNSSVDTAKTNLENAINALQTTVTLNANGGTINGAATTAFNVTIGAETSVTSDLSSYIPVRDGYRFKGWGTSADAESGAMTVTTGFMPTLYAVWEEILTYTVAYNANGGSGSIANVTVEFGKSVTLPSSGFVREGYSLIGWSTNSTATTATYAPGQTVSGLSSTSGETVTLYAIWAEYKYTVVYDANGGSGSIASKTVNLSETFTLASAGFTKDGYSLAGWATTASATAPVYQLGQSVSKLSTTNGATVTLYAVWRSNVALVSDVVVLDFSTPIVISPTDNDNSLKGLTYSVIGISADGANYASTLNGDYGTFTLNSTKEIIYTPTKAMSGTEMIYYHVSVNGSTLKETITVAPASNVLYEETFFTNGTTGKSPWTPVGTAKKVNQEAYPYSRNKTEVYGYDESYSSNSQYSNGSALQVDINSTNMRSEIKMFEFAGSGFDINGVCGKNTGVLIVSLMDTDANDGKGKMVKSYVIDTYYNDVDGDGADLYADKLYQVPVIHEDAIGFSNYKVQIVAAWLPTMSSAIKAAQKAETQSVEGFDDMTMSTAAVEDDAELRAALAEIGMEDILNAEDVEIIWFDDNSVLNGGEGAATPAEGMMKTAGLEDFYLVNVIDSVRVYNPLDIDDQYYIGSEKGAMYFNVMDNLVNGDSNSTITGSGNYFVYVTGSELGNVDIDNYKEHGPKDELYLATTAEGENAVAFAIENFAGSGAKVAISLRAAQGNPEVKIGESKFIISSNTEMYYDITECVASDETTGKGTITIQNLTAGTLLTIGSVKVSGTLAEGAALSSDVDLMTVRTMMMAPAETVEPNTPKVPAEPEEPTDEPTDAPADEPVEDPAESDDESSCWLVRLFKWLVEKFTIIFNAVKSILGF